VVPWKCRNFSVTRREPDARCRRVAHFFLRFTSKGVMEVGGVEEADGVPEADGNRIGLRVKSISATLS
jgi:hypothetical protein